MKFWNQLMPYQKAAWTFTGIGALSVIGAGASIMPAILEGDEIQRKHLMWFLGFLALCGTSLFLAMISITNQDRQVR